MFPLLPLLASPVLIVVDPLSFSALDLSTPAVDTATLLVTASEESLRVIKWSVWAWKAPIKSISRACLSTW